MPDLLSRIHGCIAGLALGDAFGMPGQPTPEATRARNGGWITQLLPPPPGDLTGHAGLRAGQATDDTTAMLALLRSVIRYGEVRQDRVAEALIAWVESLGGLDTPYIGPSTKRAIRALKEGVNPAESGRAGWTNGAAMRVAPLGFLYAPDLERTARAAVDSAYPTHATATACSAAAAVACAVAICVQPGVTLGDVISAAKTGADLGEKLGVESVSPSISRRIDFALHLVDTPASDEQKLRDLYDYIGMGMAAYETLPVCIALVHLSAGDPMRAITLAANMGGDTDTVAAIAGAICGAYSGFEALSAEMVQTVEQVNGYDFRALAVEYDDLVRGLRA